MDRYLRASEGLPALEDEEQVAEAQRAWRHWNWVTEHAGIPRPTNGVDQRWLILRTVEPIARLPDRMTIWVLGHCEAVAALRRIESYWDDLPAYDGDRMYWRAYELHPAAIESHTLEDADWRAIVISENEDVHMAQHVPIYYEVRYNIRKADSVGAVQEGKAIYAPRLITASVFLQMIDVLAMRLKQFQCVVATDGVQTPQMMHLHAGSFVLVTMDMVDVQREADEEVEEEVPLPAPSPRGTSDTTSVSSGESSPVHTPTICDMNDMLENYHIYRPHFHRDGDVRLSLLIHRSEVHCSRRLESIGQMWQIRRGI